MKVKALEWLGDRLQFIDQRLLPGRLKLVETRRWEVVREAIRRLSIRGAPLIGIAAAYGVVLAARYHRNRRPLVPYLKQVIDSFRRTRPTAVNLFYSLDLMADVIEHHSEKGSLPEMLEAKAEQLMEEEIARCEAIARLGADLIPEGAKILTLCNTGFLATPSGGTALGVIYEAHQQGKRIRVYVLETRPLLQGSRLTMWELSQMGIDAILLADGALAHLLTEESLDLALIGADRIARNGDTANKVGSYNLALLCHHFSLPLYVAAPWSTIDGRIATGSEIPIEMRPAGELVSWRGLQVAPSGVSVYNPAFDIVPSSLIGAIITDRGVFRPPFMFTDD